MRVAIIIYSEKKDQNSKIDSISSSLRKGFERNGHNVDIVFSSKDGNKNLTLYDFLMVVSYPVSPFSSKIPTGLSRYLSSCGKVSGKRACCILSGFSLFKNKALQNLMRETESEGIIIKTAEIINKADEAEAYALHINL